MVKGDDADKQAQRDLDVARKRAAAGAGSQQPWAEWMRTDRQSDWAPIGRSGQLVQLPVKNVRVYDSITLWSMFGLGIIIGAMVVLVLTVR